MNQVTVIWSAMSGACVMLALMHLVIWLRDRRSWANLWFSIATLGVVGLAVCELVTMNAPSPEVYAAGIRHAHFVYIFAVAGILGYVHCHFGTGRIGLLWLALGLRVLAIVANFTTGQSLHVAEVRSLGRMTFFGETVTVLGDWVANPWVILGQLSALVLLIYLVDASLRLWRKGSDENRRRALLLGGSLSLFVTTASVQSALVAAGGLRMPFFISLPYLGIVLVMGYELSRDVLRAARLASELSVSRERLRQAAAAGNLALWEWDIGTDHIWISDEGRKLYGVDPHEKLDFKRFGATLHPDDREAVAQAVEKAIAGPDPYEVKHRVLLPDGKVGWIAAGGRVERDPGGRATMLRGVSLDITDRQRAEQESARQQRELAHLSRVSILGELSGTLAHELNQPLTAILGNAQVGSGSLRAPSPDLVEMAAILDDIAHDAKRAGGIIHGMRAMFKKDTAPDPQPVDVNEAATQVLHLLHSEIVARKVRLETRLEPGLPQVSAGRVEIQQVLINLIMNGLDAMKGQPGERRLEITTCGMEHRIRVTVRDHGPGVPADMMERLFEPFVSTKQNGLGLGLAISRNIIQRFHGELRAENHPEGGAVFECFLPVIPDRINLAQNG
jgi:PAS domain S-box-containing protein